VGMLGCIPRVQGARGAGEEGKGSLRVCESTWSEEACSLFRKTWWGEEEGCPGREGVVEVLNAVQA